jgi:hypothetical protein
MHYFHEKCSISQTKSKRVREGERYQHVKQKEKRAIFFAKLIAEPLNGKMQHNQISIGYIKDQFNKAKMAYASDNIKRM